jgi:hypothetical protein
VKAAVPVVALASVSPGTKPLSVPVSAGHPVPATAVTGVAA